MGLIGTLVSQCSFWLLPEFRPPCIGISMLSWCSDCQCGDHQVHGGRDHEVAQPSPSVYVDPYDAGCGHCHWSNSWWYVRLSTPLVGSSIIIQTSVCLTWQITSLIRKNSVPSWFAQEGKLGFTGFGGIVSNPSSVPSHFGPDVVYADPVVLLPRRITSGYGLSSRFLSNHGKGWTKRTLTSRSWVTNPHRTAPLHPMTPHHWHPRFNPKNKTLGFGRWPKSATFDESYNRLLWCSYHQTVWMPCLSCTSPRLSPLEI